MMRSNYFTDMECMIRKLFEYRRVSKVNIYSINEFEDYYYGYMVPDTGYLKYFSLHLYDEGFVIQMPVKEQPEKIPEFRPSPKLFHVLKESVLWGDCQDIETVGALNEMVTKGDMREVVLVQEAYQERRIGETDCRPERCSVCFDRRAIIFRKNDIFT